MTVQYMSLTEVAQFLGITKGALSTLKLPEPDVRIGKTRGWKKATIITWNAQRPGRGNFTKRK
ncbi:helix-turn-helix transcriptional regulator [Alloscardovia criceti]|uniref:helix-turn-helix transcriptional regulator n=1 Tax=Alloscardovia criceti TaxID=356828 RepID=UPI00037E8BF0|nr:hypothetical protein [Alloscardovia criceti]